MMETRTCKVCGRELPEANFPMGRWGRVNTCKECRAAALRETKAAKHARMGGQTGPLFRPGLRRERPPRSHRHDGALPEVA